MRSGVTAYKLPQMLNRHTGTTYTHALGLAHGRGVDRHSTCINTRSPDKARQADDDDDDDVDDNGSRQHKPREHKHVHDAKHSHTHTHTQVLAHIRR